MGHRNWTAIEQGALLRAYPALREFSVALGGHLDESIELLAARLLQHPHPVEATHQTLADEVGTRREVVSRILETFQHSGWIRLGRKRIEILDTRALADRHQVEGA